LIAVVLFYVHAFTIHRIKLQNCTVRDFQLSIVYIIRANLYMVDNLMHDS